MSLRGENDDESRWFVVRFDLIFRHISQIKVWIFISVLTCFFLLYISNLENIHIISSICQAF
jgi:hypothetical protein